MHVTFKWLKKNYKETKIAFSLEFHGLLIFFTFFNSATVVLVNKDGSYTRGKTLLVFRSFFLMVTCGILFNGLETEELP